MVFSFISLRLTSHLILLVYKDDYTTVWWIISICYLGTASFIFTFVSSEWSFSKRRISFLFYSYHKGFIDLPLDFYSGNKNHATKDKFKQLAITHHIKNKNKGRLKLISLIFQIKIYYVFKPYYTMKWITR